jgi:hypothetical protein
MPELQELSMQFEQFKQTKEAEDKALKAEIKKLQQEAEAYRARVTMYEEVHTKTFNEDRALRERNRWLETQLEDVRASAFQTDFLTPVKVSLLPVGHMASLSAGGSTRISSGAKFQRQLRRTKAQEEAAFVPTNLGAFPFEEHVPSKPAVESAAAVEATTEVAVSVAAEEAGAPVTVTAPATSEEARPVAAEAPAQVEVAMEEPQAVPVGSEGGAPIAAIAPAKPAVEEAEVPVVQSVVATEAPALVAAPPSAAAPPPGRKGEASGASPR